MTRVLETPRLSKAFLAIALKGSHRRLPALRRVGSPARAIWRGSCPAVDLSHYQRTMPNLRRRRAGARAWPPPRPPRDRPTHPLSGWILSLIRKTALYLLPPCSCWPAPAIHPWRRRARRPAASRRRRRRRWPRPRISPPRPIRRPRSRSPGPTSRRGETGFEVWRSTTGPHRHLLEAHDHRRQREDLEGHRPHHGDTVLLPGARGGRHALGVHERRLRHHAAQDADRLRRAALGVEGHPAHLDRQADGRGGVRGLALHYGLRRDLHSRRERPGEYDLRQRCRAERRRPGTATRCARSEPPDSRRRCSPPSPAPRRPPPSWCGRSCLATPIPTGARTSSRPIGSRPTSRSSRGSSRATRRSLFRGREGGLGVASRARHDLPRGESRDRRHDDGRRRVRRPRPLAARARPTRAPW